jgi:hypothetical protein
MVNPKGSRRRGIPLAFPCALCSPKDQKVSPKGEVNHGNSENSQPPKGVDNGIELGLLCKGFIGKSMRQQP